MRERLGNINLELVKGRVLENKKAYFPQQLQGAFVEIIFMQYFVNQYHQYTK